MASGIRRKLTGKLETTEKLEEKSTMQRKRQSNLESSFWLPGKRIYVNPQALNLGREDQSLRADLLTNHIQQEIYTRIQQSYTKNVTM